MNWYLEALKKYAVFSGRASRKEFWMFSLFNIIISCVLGVILGMLRGPKIIGDLYALFILIPSTTVSVRRMHDTDHSWWWGLFPIVNLILAVREGQRGDNRFGPDPKATTP